MSSNVITLPVRARPLAAGCVRRARATTGLTQESLAHAIGAGERTVRRRESGRADLGLIEEALRCPRFAKALGAELIAAAERLGAASPRAELEQEPDLLEVA